MTYQVKWNNDILDPMREAGDPVGDQLVAELIRDGSRKQASEAMQALVLNGDLISAELPPNLQTYFTNTAALPDFADPQKIAAAQTLYRLYNLEIGTMLMYAALPACYAAEKGAQVLMLTERMSDYGQIQKRLSETGQFVFDVMGPDGFAPQGRAIRSAQKVRLVHAMVRHHILNAPNRSDIWNDAWGTPINQEDMAGTMLAFSVHVLNGLDRIGIVLSPDEIEAFYHLWRVVGYLLGVAPEMLPVDHNDAMDLAHTIAARHFAPSEAGQHLTRAILDLLEQGVPTRLRNYPHAMMRFCLGDEIADMIGVNPSDWTAQLVKTRFGMLEQLDSLRYADGWQRQLVWQQSREALGRAGFMIMDRLGKMPTMGYAPFEMPSRLAQRAD